MADDLDTGKETPAQGSEADNQSPPVDDKDKGEKQKPFSPEQEQFMGSWMGRLIKKQFEESIVPLIRDAQQRPAHTAGNPNEVIKNFNEKLSEKLFTDPLGAIQDAVGAIEESKTQLSKSQAVQVDKAITSFSEEPLYKDIYQDMKAIAHDAVKEGYPPGPAAKYAFAQAKANFLEKGSRGSEGGLDLADGGRPSRTVKTPKLPVEFKKAAARDIAKGYFKDEADYIANLSPAIRSKYGI